MFDDDIEIEKSQEEARTVRANQLAREQGLKEPESEGEKEKAAPKEKGGFYENAKKILLSNGLGNAFTITLTALTLAGVFASPFGPVVAGVLGGLSLLSVAIGVTVDTLQARSLRKLEKENNLLVKNRDAKGLQEDILSKDPKLAEILKDDLYKPITEGKKSVTERYKETSTKAAVKGVGKAFLKYGIDTALAVVNTVANGAQSLLLRIGKMGLALFTLGSEANTKVSVDKVRHKFKAQIDSERDKKDTPGYNNIRELKEATREQRIQTMALKKLTSDKDYSTMAPDQIKERFKEIKLEIAATEKAIGTQRNIFARIGKAIFSVGKDVARGQNPYSRFNNPDKIKVEAPADLTKQVQKEKALQGLTSVKTVSSTLNKHASKEQKPLAETQVEKLKKREDLAKLNPSSLQKS